MEVGAVKQAFNNEVISMKKNLNQARIQIIHKLTRKAKTLVEKKAPAQLNEKLKRKAEYAVKEVLLIKQIKAKDLAKFIVTHQGELSSFLNKPLVDNDKACARLLLHKALSEKYKLIRTRFSNVPIKDLFMSRLERRKIKKEARDLKKNKRKEKEKRKQEREQNVVNSVGDWDVEDITVDKSITSEQTQITEETDDSKHLQNLSENNDMEVTNIDDSDLSETDNDFEGNNKCISDIVESETNKDSCSSKNLKPIKKLQNGIEKHKINNVPDVPKKALSQNFELKNKQDSQKKGNKPKDPNKNKNLNEKLQSRKFKKSSKEAPIQETRIVDPFFITSTGENYMSVVEPRQPDEFKEEHRQGNRKLRRAVMFGYAPKIKHRADNFNNNNKFNKDDFQMNSRFDNPYKNDWSNSDNKSSFKKKNGFESMNNNSVESKPEKLHPSWEAKKKQSGILPFQGKKIVFEES